MAEPGVTKKRPLFVSTKTKSVTLNSPDEIRKLQESVLEKNKYKLEKCSIRSILMVGRSRVGKTTAFRVLKNPTLPPLGFSIFSQTKEASCKTFALDCKTENPCKYTFFFIDSPGMMEDTPEDEIESKRSDEEILCTISTCLKSAVTKINAICIFISVVTGVTESDIECIQRYLDAFDAPGLPLFICITRAEDKDEVWMENVVDQLWEHSFFSNLFETRENIRICFVGCVDENARTANRPASLKNLYTNVKNLRDAFLEDLFTADTQVSLLKLPAIQEPKRRSISYLQEQLDILERLDSMADLNTPETKLQLDRIMALQNEITNIGVIGYVSEDEVTNMLLNARALSTRIHDRLEDKSQLKFDYGEVMGHN